MPWKASTEVSLRREFITFALKPGTNIRQLCRQMHISPKTGYKWLKRYRQSELAGLENQSRRPHRSPARTAATIEAHVVALRTEHPQWGGRKLHRVLLNAGVAMVPAPSTMTDILRRHGLIDPEQSAKHQPYVRFERSEPNQLWQMDFKGHIPLVSPSVRCHPLGIVDDHARFALGLQACSGETFMTVQDCFISVFRRYGLPQALLADNGPPWGSRGEDYYTQFGVWLLRLDIALLHSRVRHPETHGKIERFNRTLKAEVLQGRTFTNLVDCQQAFDRWRELYNFDRPHDALQMQVPADCYRPSKRIYPEVLPAIEYGPGDIVRKVQHKGEIYFRSRTFKIGKAFHGLPVALRPTTVDGIYDVYFCYQKIYSVSLQNNSLILPSPVTHVPVQVLPISPV